MKIVLLLLFFYSLFGIEIDKNVNLEKFEFLEDSSKNYQLVDVENLHFTPLPEGVVNFGFSKSSYWLHLQLDVNDYREWLLQIEYPLLKKVNVSLLKDSKLLKKEEFGLEVPFSQRELKHRFMTFSMQLEPKEQYDIYIRVESEGVIEIPIKVLPIEKAFEDQQLDTFFLGIYYGTFLLLALYNLVNFYFTRSRNYIYYLFFLFTFVLWQFAFNGLGNKYFWGDSPWFSQNISIIGISLSAVSSVVFARQFLRIEKYYPKLYQLSDYIVVGLSLNVFLSLIFSYYYMIQFNMYLSIVITISLFLLSLFVFQKGYLPARLYFAGWSSILLGNIFFIMNETGNFNSIFIFHYAQQIGSFLEMLFISWALSDHAHLKIEESINKKDTLNVKLQERVEDALKKARDKDKILIQQSRFAALGEMIEQIAHQWRQPLNTLALINQDIYFKIQLGTFKESSYDIAHKKMNESLQYMSKTIDDFRDFYKNDDKMDFFYLKEACESAFSLSDAMLHYAKIEYSLVERSGKSKIYGNRNQLIQVIMNLIKNSHDVIVDFARKEGNIKLTILSDKEKVILLFEDDGGGIREDVIDKIFDPYFTTKDSKKGTGVGLAMTKDILEKTFSGKILVSNSANGAVFRITIPLNRRVS